MATLTVKNVAGQIVSFQGNMTAKQAIFGVQLASADGTPLGQVQIGVGPETQAASAMQNEIPGWDEFIASSPKAQALLDAIGEFGLELADKYSKIIDVDETPIIAE